MKTVVVAFVFLCTAVLAIPISNSVYGRSYRDIENVIVGGSNARRHQFPYQISLQKTGFGVSEHICGGSIISPTFVVTAGHCIDEDAELRVVAGLLDKDNEKHHDVQIAEVVRTIVHPDFDRESISGVASNDIALVELGKPLKYTKAVKPIFLPEPGFEPTGMAHLSGWGAKTDMFFPIYPNRLQHTTLPLIPFEECKLGVNITLGDSNPLTRTMLCTGSLYRGVSGCYGDSGGPLEQHNRLIGIASWVVTPCGTTGAPSMYTKTSYYIYFIREFVHDLS